MSDHQEILRMVRTLTGPMREALIEEYREVISHATNRTRAALVDRGLMEWDKETAAACGGAGWILSDMGRQVAAHFARSNP